MQAPNGTTELPRLLRTPLDYGLERKNDKDGEWAIHLGPLITHLHASADLFVAD